ncbi:MAG: SurA N-terminal domain-containing protein [Desulfatibacillaceae bacterium]
MLEYMRKNATSPFIKVIFVIIVLVFVFWGVGSYRSSRVGRVAMVNGETISAAELSRLKSNMREYYRQQYGERLDEATLERLNIPGKALDQLISQELLLEKARKLGLEVTDRELVDYIRSQAAFQNRGRFDKAFYQRALAGQRYTPEEFESIQRDYLLYQKIRSLLLGAAAVSEQEARQWYEWVNKQVDVAYAAAEPASYTGLTPTGDRLREYYEDHTEEYRTPLMLKAEYVAFEPRRFLDEVEAPEDEIEEYYEANPGEFEREETVKARHVLIRVEQDASDEQVEETKKRAMEVARKARADEDFAELAKEYSDGPSATRGGDLGAFTREDMVPAFSEAAFSLNPGEVSDPVRTQFGWHVIKVEEVNEAGTLTLEEARSRVAQAIKERKAENEAFARALDLYDNTLNLRDLEDAARETGVQLETTGYFSRNDPPKQLTDGAKFAEEAFKLNTGEFSDVLELSDGFFIIQVIEQKPPRIPAFEEVRSEVEQDVLAEMRREKAREVAQNVLDAASGETSFAEAAEERGLDVKETGFFKRTDSMPDLGFDPDLFEALFSLSLERPMPDSPIEVGGKFYVAQLKDVRRADPENFVEEKADTIENLRLIKRQQMLSSWIEAVRADADIQIDQQALDAVR